MATIHGTAVSGKVENKIYYTINGQQYVRSMPTHMANPQTEAQQAHRNNFVDIVRLSSYTTAAHTIGLHYHASRQKPKLRTYNDFRSLNKNCFTSDGQIDYPRVIVSYGSVPCVWFTSVQIEASSDKIGGLRLHLTYAPDSGNSDDELFLFALCPALCTGTLFKPVPRKAGVLTVMLPSGWPSEGIHLYAFLRGRRNLTSDTIYIPLPTE